MDILKPRVKYRSGDAGLAMDGTDEHGTHEALSELAVDHEKSMFLPKVLFHEN